MNVRRKTSKYLKRLKAGDSSCFDKFFRLVYPYVDYVVRENLVNPLYIGDAIAETFGAVIKNIDSYDDEQNGHGWIGTIAKNVARNINEHEKNLKQRESEHLRLDPVRGIAETAAVAENAAIEAVDLHSALSLLDELDRKIVIMYAVAGYTFAEIAQKTGMAVSTVHEHYQKSKEKLKNFLK